MPENINISIKEFKEAKKGDLLGFNGQTWVPVSIDKVLETILIEFKDVKEQLELEKIRLNNVKIEYDEKVREFEQRYTEFKTTVVGSVLELKNIIEQKDEEGDPL